MTRHFSTNARIAEVLTEGLNQFNYQFISAFNFDDYQIFNEIKRRKQFM